MTDGLLSWLEPISDRNCNVSRERDHQVKMADISQNQIGWKHTFCKRHVINLMGTNNRYTYKIQRLAVLKV